MSLATLGAVHKGQPRCGKQLPTVRCRIQTGSFVRAPDSEKLPNFPRVGSQDWSDPQPTLAQCTRSQQPQDSLEKTSLFTTALNMDRSGLTLLAATCSQRLSNSRTLNRSTYQPLNCCTTSRPKTLVIAHNCGEHGFSGVDCVGNDSQPTALVRN